MSMFKFLFGLTTGFAVGLSWWESATLTVLGMMASVLLFTFAGTQLKRYILDPYLRKKSKKLFTRRNRMIIKVWRIYGLAGVAFLTPLILTPIGGTLVASSFGERWHRIFIYMLFSAVFWSFSQVFVIYFLGNQGLDVFQNLLK